MVYQMPINYIAKLICQYATKFCLLVESLSLYLKEGEWLKSAPKSVSIWFEPPTSSQDVCWGGGGNWIKVAEIWSR